MWDVKIYEGPVDLPIGQVIASVRGNPELNEAGCIALYLGIVRGVSEDGREVESFLVEGDRDEVEKLLRHLAARLEGRWGVIDVRIHLVMGRLSVGDPILLVVVAGEYREDVLQAVKDAVDAIKSLKVLRKTEVLRQGE